MKHIFHGSDLQLHERTDDVGPCDGIMIRIAIQTGRVDEMNYRSFSTDCDRLTATLCRREQIFDAAILFALGFRYELQR